MIRFLIKKYFRNALKLSTLTVFISGVSVSFGQMHPLYRAELDSAGLSLVQMRLEAAESLGNDFIARNPENPSGHLFRAITLGWKFFFTPKGEDTGQLEESISQAGADCRKYADRYRKRDETRFEGTVCLGMIYGLEALMAMLDDRYLVMAPLALKAWDSLQEASSIDPEYYDLYFGLGLYRYFTDVLPKVVKLLAVAYGFEGDREQGLANLRLAVQRGEYTGQAARVMLVNLYCYMETPDDSVLELARNLYRRFPDNPLIHWRYGDILMRLKRYGQAVEVYREVADRIEKDRPYYRNRMFTPFSFYFRLGLCNQRLGKKDEALKNYETVLAGEKVEPDWVVPWSHVHAAEIKLAEGKTPEAADHLKKAVKLDDSKGSRQRAKSLLEQIKK
jgi:tetratricopeptide (TPR) repeat protein